MSPTRYIFALLMLLVCLPAVAERLRVSDYDAAALQPKAELDETAARQEGERLAREMASRENGWGTSNSTARMVLKNRKGRETQRVLRVRALEGNGPNGSDKVIAIFDEPRDVAGTALLTHTHSNRDDDQWLFIPALKRVKRIASRNRSGPFMGSEFAYEDLGSQASNKFTHRYLGRKELNGQLCHVLERKPKDRYSGYSKTVSWLDETQLHALRVEFYDRKGSHIKTLELNQWQQYKERYWRPGLVTMTNHQNGNVTEVFWSNFEFDVGYEERDFDKSALSRIR